jgi:beta-barrel assembly-enhancing protease
MLIKKILILCFAAILSVGMLSCGSSQGGGINLFTPEQDIELGKQTEKEISDHPTEYPVLPERGNEQVYSYIRGITAKLLNTGKVAYRDQFAWQVKIINDDKTLNAFCTPGGYIYVYTTNQMTKSYGLSALLSIVTGNSNPGLLEQIALGLVSLKFSRGHETDADNYSVIYMCETGYNAAGAAGFFRKLEGKSGNPPEFLSTHPNPGNRISNIEKKAKDMGCKGSSTNVSEYNRIKAALK